MCTAGIITVFWFEKKDTVTLTSRGQQWDKNATNMACTVQHTWMSNTSGLFHLNNLCPSFFSWQNYKLIRRAAGGQWFKPFVSTSICPAALTKKLNPYQLLTSVLLVEEGKTKKNLSITNSFSKTHHIIIIIVDTCPMTDKSRGFISSPTHSSLLTLQFFEETKGVGSLLCQSPPLLLQSSFFLPALLQTHCHTLCLTHRFLMWG